MNYDELLEIKQEKERGICNIPFGTLCRKQIDNKFVHVVELKPQLVDSLVFTEALKRECQENLTIKHPRQLHFEVIADSGGIYSYRLEAGNYQTLEQLLKDNPAIIAHSTWVEQLIEGLMELSDELERNGIYHLCFAPSNIFVRNSDHEVMLLNHGSYYQACRLDQLFQGCEDYLAPEVMQQATADSRSDVYSLGKLLVRLYADSVLPLELKAVVKKATAEKPEDRYASAGEMLETIKRRRQAKRGVFMGAGALFVTFLCVGLFFSLLPDAENVEFVNPAADQKVPVNEYGEELRPEELGLIAGDTLRVVDGDTVRVMEVPADADQRMKQYEAKAEQIFRKQYEKEADRILSKIYNKERMNADEKAFMSQSKAVSEELAAAQSKIAESSHLSSETTQRIAAEIVEKITKRKQADIRPSKGIQK